MADGRPEAAASLAQWVRSSAPPGSNISRLNSMDSFCSGRTTNPASPETDTNPDPDLEEDGAAEQQATTVRTGEGAAAAAVSSHSQPQPPYQPQHAAMKQQNKQHAAFPDFPNFPAWPTDGGRYEYLRWLGQGSYAEVAEARDRRTGKRVAIKRMRDALHFRWDALRVYREVLLLAKLSPMATMAMAPEEEEEPGSSSSSSSYGQGHGQGHPNLVRLVDVILPDSYSDFHELVLVFEAADTDLGSVLASPQQLHDGHVGLFLYQILLGLQHLHEAGVVHRDIKPQNVLARSDCALTLCDLGLSRVLLERPLSARLFHQHQHQHQHQQEQEHEQEAAPSLASLPPPPALLGSLQQTKHVVTRWYRAPELILRQPYTGQVDMWSVGCLAAELLAKAQQPHAPVRPLFPGRGCFPLTRQSGPEPGDQLATIFRVLGGGPGPYTLRSMGLSPPLRAYVVRMAGMANQGRRLPLEPPIPAVAAAAAAAAAAAVGAAVAGAGAAAAQPMEVVGEEEAREESKASGMGEVEGAEEEARMELARTTEVLRRRFPDANPLGLDLVARMLAIDPARRITCAAALQHPYLQRAETCCGGNNSNSGGSNKMPPRAVAASLWTREELAVLEDGHDLDAEQIRQGLWAALHAFRATTANNHSSSSAASGGSPRVTKRTAEAAMSMAIDAC